MTEPQLKDNNIPNTQDYYFCKHSGGPTEIVKPYIRDGIRYINYRGMERNVNTLSLSDWFFSDPIELPKVKPNIKDYQKWKYGGMTLTVRYSHNGTKYEAEYYYLQVEVEPDYNKLKLAIGDEVYVNQYHLQNWLHKHAEYISG